jgi:hypothetical protein
MFTRRDARNRTIAIEVTGFVLVAIIIWCNELFDLPHHLLGAPASPTRLGEAGIESLALLMVAIVVIRTTAGLFRRLAEQAQQLITCSACQRVQYRGEWMEFREYVEETANTRSTDGMCPVCVHMVRDLIDHPLPESQSTSVRDNR